MRVPTSLWLSASLTIAVFLSANGVELQADDHVENGVAWLESVQNADGSWGDGGRKLVDTIEVHKTLASLNMGIDALNDSLAFIVSVEESDNDKTARKLSALVHSTADVSEMIAQLLSAQNEDGGWGLGSKKASSIEDTLLVLDALLKSETSADQSISKGRDFVIARQGSNGSWLCSDETAPSDLARTCRALIILKSLENAGFGSSELSNAVTASAQYIDSQLSGSSFGTVIETAFAYLALIKVRQPSGLQNVLSWLTNEQGPDGSWDGDVFATAVVLRALSAVRPPDQPPMPDMEITESSIIFDPTTPSTGEMVSITATILNIGETEAQDVDVEFFNGDPRLDGVAIGSTHCVASIPAEGSVQVEETFDTSELVGTRQIVVFVDRNNVIPEIQEVNNAATKLITIGGVPDLVVAPGDIVLSNTSPIAFEPIDVTATVRNVGNTAAENVIVRFLDGGVKITDLTLGGVNAGESNTATLTTGLTEGDHTLTVQVDPDGLISDEVVTANNEAETSITVEPIPVSPADLKVESVTATPSVPLAGEAATVKTMVINQGGEPVTTPFQVVIKDGSTVLHTFEVPSLASGQRTVLTLDASFAAGDHTVTATADPTGTVVESDETNNSGTVIVSAQSTATDPDLVVASFTADPSTAFVGDPVQLNAVVKNTGTLAADNVKVRILESQNQLGGDFTIPTLGGGSTGGIQLTTTFATAGSKMLTVVVDPEDTVPETNETNNEASASVEIQSTPRPDLVVSDDDITFSNDSPIPGETVQISVDIHNQGTTSSGPFKVLFTEGNPFVSGATLIEEVEAPSVPAGGTGDVAIDFTPSPGDNDVFVLVDHDHVVVESNEANNLSVDFPGVDPVPVDSRVDENGNTILKWEFPELKIGDEIRLSYALDLHDMTPNERREVAKSTELTYDNIDGNRVEESIGPTEVNAKVPLDVIIDVENDSYGANQNANIDIDLTLGDNAAESLSDQTDWEGGELNGASASFADGELTLDVAQSYPVVDLYPNGDFENGGVNNWSMNGYFDLQVDGGNPLDGVYSLRASLYDGLGFIHKDAVIPADAYSARLSLLDRKSSGGNSDEYKIQVRDTSNNVLKTLHSSFESTWPTTARSFDLTEFAGRTIRLCFYHKAYYGMTFHVDNINLEVERYEFQPSGSARYVLDAGVPVIWNRLIVQDTAPDGTSISLKVRGADSEYDLSNTSFSEPLVFLDGAAELPETGSRLLEIHIDMTTAAVKTTPRLDFLKATCFKATSEDNLNLNVRIRDERGMEAASWNSMKIHPERGRTHHFDLVFNTGGSLPGDYLAVASVEMNEQTVTEDDDPFEIIAVEPALVVDGAVATDKMTYADDETAVITAKILNKSENLPLSDVNATLEILNQSGALVEQFDYDISYLPTKTTDVKTVDMPLSGMSPETYVVRQTVSLDGDELFQREASFEIVTSVLVGKGLAGTLLLNPPVVKRNVGDLDLNVTAENTGNVDLDDVTLKVDVFDPGTFEILKSFSSSIQLPMSGGGHSAAFDYDGVTLMPGSYPAAYAAEVNYEGEIIEIPLDVNGFTVTNDPPIANAGPDQTIEGTSPDGDLAALDGSGSTDANSTNPPDMDDDIVSHEWKEGETILGQGETLQHVFTWGTHAVTLTVEDSVGATDSDETIISIVDTTPPTITGVTPPHETILADAAPTIEATLGDTCSGVNPASIVLILDGTELAAAYDETTGSLTAADNAGNQATTESWTFGVDMTAPVISALSPEPGSIVNENHMLLFSRDGDLHISANTAVLKGILYAPNGDAKMTSSGETVEGALIADTVHISGSGITFVRWGEGAME